MNLSYRLFKSRGSNEFLEKYVTENKNISRATCERMRLRYEVHLTDVSYTVREKRKYMLCVKWRNLCLTTDWTKLHWQQEEDNYVDCTASCCPETRNNRNLDRCFHLIENESRVQTVQPIVSNPSQESLVYWPAHTSDERSRLFIFGPRTQMKRPTTIPIQCSELLD